MLEPGSFDEAVAPSEEQLKPTKEDHLYRALGQLDGDASLASIQRTFTSEGIDGFYEPETDTLVVSGTIDDYTRVVLVHELAHALDGQHYDLTQIYDEREPDALIALRGLMEGSATRVEEAYVAQMTPSEAVRYREAYDGRLRDLDGFEAFPPVFLAAQSIPYTPGSWFVDALVDAGQESAIAAAFDAPPVTSAEILHPWRHLAGLPAVDVPVPAADGPVVGEGILGEARLFGLLAEGSGDDEAWTLQADGWAGDRYVVWTEGTESCLRLHIAVDTIGDGDELQTGLLAWTERQPDAVVERLADTRVELLTCSP